MGGTFLYDCSKVEIGISIFVFHLDGPMESCDLNSLIWIRKHNTQTLKKQIKNVHKRYF